MSAGPAEPCQADIKNKNVSINVWAIGAQEIAHPGGVSKHFFFLITSEVLEQVAAMSHRKMSLSITRADDAAAIGTRIGFRNS